tara:strand:- start:39 stop:431 length:393 start_codon:yes stop_codon:yes gene_type:complete
METYLYFAGVDGGGGGADATNQAAMWPASSFIGVEPLAAGTTKIHFKSTFNDIDIGTASDTVTVTHADTHATAGSYHRSKIIAEAMVEAANCTEPGKVITIIDADEAIYFGGIKNIKDDAGFDIVIAIDS